MLTISRIEKASVILALILSPFWFFQIFNLNLGVGDLLLITAFLTLVLRNGIYPVLPNRASFAGVVLFLLAAGISLVVATSPVDGLFNYLQYILIFIVVVPVAVSVFQDRQARHIGVLGLWIVLNLLTLWAAYESLSVTKLRKVTLLYANQNQLFWLISSAFILDLGILFDKHKPTNIRVFSAILSLPALYLVFGGLTLSAILAVITGSWLIVARFIRDLGKRESQAFTACSLFAGISGIVLTILRWEWVYIQGSLESRFAQYTTAIQYGTRNQPFGIGLESGAQVLEGVIYITSIHNFFLAYYLEIGVVGALAFTLILINWTRIVLIPAIIDSPLQMTDVAVVSIFAAGVVIMLVQPVPVNRYWWLIYSLSWGIIYDKKVSGNQTHH
jgi:hypothetical protein